MGATLFLHLDCSWKKKINTKEDNQHVFTLSFYVSIKNAESILSITFYLSLKNAELILTISFYFCIKNTESMV